MQECTLCGQMQTLETYFVKIAGATWVQWSLVLRTNHCFMTAVIKNNTDQRYTKSISVQMEEVLFYSFIILKGYLPVAISNI